MSPTKSDDSNKRPVKKQTVREYDALTALILYGFSQGTKK